MNAISERVKIDKTKMHQTSQMKTSEKVPDQYSQSHSTAFTSNFNAGNLTLKPALSKPLQQISVVPLDATIKTTTTG